MSLSTMTNDLARPGPQQFAEAIMAENAPQGATPTASSTKKAFDALAKFIPAEVLAPFLLVMQLVGKSPDEGGLDWDARSVYWAFVLITPLMLILFEYAKTAEANLKWPDTKQVLWRAFVAMIAFAVWSLAVPDNPYQEAIGAVIAGLLAVTVSPILWALDAVVIKILSQAPKP